MSAMNSQAHFGSIQGTLNSTGGHPALDNNDFTQDANDVLGLPDLVLSDLAGEASADLNMGGKKRRTTSKKSSSKKSSSKKSGSKKSGSRRKSGSKRKSAAMN